MHARHAVLPAVLATILLAACASVQPDAGAPGQFGSAAGACRAEPVAWAVGKQAEQDVMRRVWHESGAGLIRPIGPDTAVTRDHRPDRVNVEIDRNNTITRVTCG
ncbi:I78 family peptidase inhibitor [Pseudoxanthomonas sp. 10H]|uniref:I78 family peptidase inhibitor n=1 Tax=Pseudoxanthomonas sp. 10H TaxID=3242729 RepID=UPI0035582353